jgi:hypothetical protein
MKLLFTVLFACFGRAAVQAKNAGPVMTFETASIDYGTIDKRANPIRKFKFTNTGNEPLLIKAARPSCVCVKASYLKEPLMPGENAFIEANYDTQRVGNFNKTNNTHTLMIKGETKAP